MRRCGRRVGSWPAVASALHLSLSASSGCVGREVGYQEVRSGLRQRTGHDATWAHLEPSGAHAKRSQALLAQPLSPDSVIELTLLNNFNVQTAFESLGMARAEALRALRLPNPRLEAGVRFGHEQPELELALTENISGLLLVPWRDKISSFELNAAKFDAVGRLLDVVLSAKQAYVEHQAALQTRDLTQALRELATSALEVAESLHTAGNMTALELALQKIQYEESCVAARSTEADVTRTAQRLRAALGLSAGTTWRKIPALPEPPSDALLLDKLEERGLARSLDLASARQRTVASEKQATLSRVAGILPELHAGVAAEKQAGQWALGPVVELELPLFYQGQAEVALAESTQRRYSALQRSLALEIRAALRASAARLVALRESAEHYHKSVLPLRALVVAETLRNYNAMSIGVLQLLQAKRGQLEASKTYVELLKTYWLARSELEQLRAGRLVPGVVAASSSVPVVSSDVAAGRASH